MISCPCCSTVSCCSTVPCCSTVTADALHVPSGVIQALFCLNLFSLSSPQMDTNDKENAWLAEKLEFEKRIAEIEAGHVEKFVKADDHASLVEQRDALNTELLNVQDELQRRQNEIQDLKHEVCCGQ